MPSLDRYHRQTLLPWIGEDGQTRLRDSHALIVGCGALGSVMADSLARAGIGTLTIVDRDLVEITNLQRQILFDESDVATGMPKAEAAKAKLARINSEVIVRAHVEDFNHRNAGRFLEGVDIILDGLDNFETRYLINDLAVTHGLPYIYGGAVGTTGVSMPILPHSQCRAFSLSPHRGEGRPNGPQTGVRGETRPPSLTWKEREGGSSEDSVERSVTWTDQKSTPCLRCVFPGAPPPGTSPTCDTAGVLGPVVSMIAAHQAAQAIKLLTGNLDALDRSLFSIDAWTNEIRRFDVSKARENGDCPCCVHGRFEFYEGAAASVTTSLCGRNAVQINPAWRDGRLDLKEVAARLAPHGSFACNEFLLRGTLSSERNGKGEPIELTLFPTGRAIIKGVTSPDAARSIYAKYIGA